MGQTKFHKSQLGKQNFRRILGGGGYYVTITVAEVVGDKNQKGQWENPQGNDRSTWGLAGWTVGEPKGN